MSSPTINEAFAARRAVLIAARHKHFETSFSFPDFAPERGFCNLWNIHLPGEPRCNYDLVAHYANDYPTAHITYCPKCGSTYTD